VLPAALSTAIDTSHIVRTSLTQPGRELVDDFRALVATGVHALGGAAAEDCAKPFDIDLEPGKGKKDA